jgi:hypothetical protein
MQRQSIRIKINGEKGSPGIGEVAKVLKGIQDAVYHIGEYLYATDSYRRSGKRIKFIEDRTKLTFIELKQGSFMAGIGGEPLEAINGKTLIDESLDIFNEYTNLFNSDQIPSEIEERSNSIIKSPNHRIRVINDFIGFWPGEENKYQLSYQKNNEKSIHLDSKKRHIFDSLSRIDIDQKMESIFGIVSAHRFLPVRKIELQTPDGKIFVKYPAQLKRKITELEEKPVKVFGEVAIDKGGKIPVHIGIEFEEKDWVLKNDDLKIYSINPDYDEALLYFQEEFYYLYERYYNGDPTKMIGPALKIKKYIANLLGE